MYKPEGNKDNFKKRVKKQLKALFAKSKIPICGYCVHHFEVYDRDGIYEVTLCLVQGYRECRKVYNNRNCKKTYKEISEEEIEIIEN